MGGGGGGSGNQMLLKLGKKSHDDPECRPNRRNVACHANMAVSNVVKPSTKNIYSLFTATYKEGNLKKPQGEALVANEYCNWQYEPHQRKIT